MSRQIFRAVVPVDGTRHILELHGPIVHVAARHEDAVDIWFIDDPASDPVLRTLQVYGTGQPLPAGAGEHVGAAITPSGRLVWHLFEMRAES